MRILTLANKFVCKSPGLKRCSRIQVQMCSLETKSLEILILGGSGRIGTAAAIHLLTTRLPFARQINLKVALAGRDVVRGQKAVQEVMREVGPDCNGEVVFEQLDWRDTTALQKQMEGKYAVVHTAGPYLDQSPTILEQSIKQQIACYVDVADPVEYIDSALQMHEQAVKNGTAAVLSAGAFPGLSNVLAIECASRLSPQKVKHVDFYYFTAGLGGSGTVNLYITNQGFGENVPIYRNGSYTPSLIAGLDSQKVDFWFEEGDKSKEVVGTRTVWAWPFPESYTVAKTLNIDGDSNVKMGTAPQLWNIILGQMCQSIPRQWWKSEQFSQFLADFSWPMVALTDQFVGETHAIRVDVTDEQGNTTSAIQTHESFRRCVGQSCAEFLIQLIRRKLQEEQQQFFGGVFLPETLLQEDDDRKKAIQRMTSTPGTISYKLKQNAKSQLNRL